MDFMCREIHEAVKYGDWELLEMAAEALHPLDFTRVLTPQKNTVLHVAVMFKQPEMADRLIELCPSLVRQANSKGDTPLHIAARDGHLPLIERLANVVGDLERGLSGEVWTMRNLEGNTAMHEALKKRHEKVARHLLKLDRGKEQGCVVNVAGESPLYLAADAGLTEFVLDLVGGGEEYSVEGPDGQTPMHIGVIRGRLEIVKILLRYSRRTETKKADRFGKTVLHYAATLGWTAISYRILVEEPSLVYAFDNDGYSPLHIAAIRGTEHVMVEDMLDINPCAAELLDRQGRNALHLAVLHGRPRMVRFLLKRPEVKLLINEPDVDGNTSLHLAAKIHHIRIAQVLLKGGPDLGVTNKQGLTALDIGIFNSPWGTFWRQVALRRSLLSSGAPNSRLVKVEKMPLRGDPHGDVKLLANTISVVATLVATVTFTAAFTLPGGLRNNDPVHEGAPVFMGSAALQVFVLSDALAFFSSISVAVLVLLAMAGDPRVLRRAVWLAFLTSLFAVPATVVAFMTALYVVLSKQGLWLAIMVLCIGCGVPLLVRHFFFRSLKYPANFVRRFQ